jgi:hypothetical protein
VTAHGKTKAYLQRFKIIDSSECPCGTGNQTVEHLIYECPKLQRERERERERVVLIRSLAKQEAWPREKSELMNKYLKYFTQFTNSMDFDKL